MSVQDSMRSKVVDLSINIALLLLLDEWRCGPRLLMTLIVFYHSFPPRLQAVQNPPKPKGHLISDLHDSQ
eukprot:6053460-Amphidinium_carterae.1